MASTCNTCGTKHKPGECPMVDGSTGRKKQKGRPRPAAPPGPCPKSRSGQHVYGFRAWVYVNQSLCSREQYCKECGKTTGRSNTGHSLDRKNKCQQCGHQF